MKGVVSMFMINTGCICCAILALTFLFYYIVCSCLKGLGVYCISAFKDVPREESRYYDKRRISRAQRRAFKKWFIILSVGAILSYFIIFTAKPWRSSSFTAFSTAS